MASQTNARYFELRQHHPRQTSSIKEVLQHTAIRKVDYVHNKAILGVRLDLRQLRAGFEQVRSTLENLTVRIQGSIGESDS